MKKTLIALAAVAATSVFAQSSVTLSGTAGTEIGRGIKAGEKASLRNPDDAQNTLAFSGTEDLGGGLKASFYAQTRFSNTNGRIIAADSNTEGLMQNVYIALSGGFGTVSAGRFLTGTQSGFDAFAGYGGEPRGDYAYVSEIGNRDNGTVQYASPNMNGFSVTVATTMTGAQAAGSRERQYFALNYSAGPLAVRLAQDRNTIVGDGNDIGLGVSYDMGVAKLFLAHANKGSTQAVSNIDGDFYNSGPVYQTKKADARAEQSVTSIGVRVPMGKATLKASFRMGDSTPVTTRYEDGAAFGVDYALSKRTGVYFDVGTNSGTGTATAFRAGVTHSF